MTELKNPGTSDATGDVIYIPCGYAGGIETFPPAMSVWYRFDQTTVEDYVAISVELAWLTQELLGKGKRERRLARRLIRAAGRRNSRIGWRRFQIPYSKTVEVRTPEHPYRLRLMECNRWD